MSRLGGGGEPEGDTKFKPDKTCKKCARNTLQKCARNTHSVLLSDNKCLLRYTKFNKFVAKNITNNALSWSVIFCAALLWTKIQR